MYALNGNTYSCTLNHSKIYGTLPEDFIFVDSTLNTNGQKYYGKMDYIPYSNDFIYDKYVKEVNEYMFGEQRIALGAAGVYNLYSSNFIDESIFAINSANKYFENNMAKAVAAAESVLNEYNTEVYLSLSPIMIY